MKRHVLDGVDLVKAANDTQAAVRIATLRPVTWPPASKPAAIM